MNDSFRSQLKRFQVGLLVLGAVALAASGVGALGNVKQFFFSYLFGVLFWLGLSLGCMMVTMIHQLTGGRWGYPTRRILEAAFSTLPLMLLLFVPIFFGLQHLYPWADPSEVALDPALHGRHLYQNTYGFVIRTVIFFGIMLWMGAVLRKNSLAQDATTDAEPTRKARFLSGPGVVIYVLAATYAYVDWILSLEKHWYSTMFPIIIVIGQILNAYAFSILMMILLRKQPPIVNVATKEQFHQLGTLLFTFVLFWTYISFGQLLIIYSGDLPAEISWYLHRIAGGWKVLLGAIALFHFFLPFFLLLFRSVKKRVASLGALAALLFLMRMVDMYWLVMPSFHEKGLVVHWMDFAAIIGVGAVWAAFFLWRLMAAPLLPVHDPGMQFAFVYAHGDQR
ncbi:MAG TPA: hypothetical protein VHH88_05870 [Verrucomicrobiae bacterium]|nr:hypothetical protein [Verrucomicrobiae bacterium]